jgi:hypothetical protein
MEKCLPWASDIQLMYKFHIRESKDQSSKPGSRHFTKTLHIFSTLKKKKKQQNSVAFRPHMNYTDRPRDRRFVGVVSANFCG